LNTGTAFVTDGAGIDVTISGTATATADTDSSGNLTAINITSAGSGYTVGDIISVVETVGSGSGTFRVASIA